MSRSTSNLAIDFSFALNAYKTTGCYRELFYVKTYAAKLLAGDYN